MKKAIALISGGLDSMLAAKVVQEQGVHVEGLNFTPASAWRATPTPSARNAAPSRAGGKDSRGRGGPFPSGKRPVRFYNSQNTSPDIALGAPGSDRARHNGKRFWPVTMAPATALLNAISRASCTSLYSPTSTPAIVRRSKRVSRNTSTTMPNFRQSSAWHRLHRPIFERVSVGPSPANATA